MKKLICIALFTTFFTSVYSQFSGWNPVTGRSRFRDSMANDKLRNNAAGDSVLSTDINGKFKNVIKNDTAYLTTIIDSSITIFNNPTCLPRIISGTVTVDSLFIGHNTDIWVEIGCKIYFINESYFIVPSSTGEDFYVGIYGDTLGSIGIIIGGSPPADLPDITDPLSQILLKIYSIPAGATTPAGAVSDYIYREGDDALGIYSSFTISTGFDTLYAVNPFAGVNSIRIPTQLNNQYFDVDLPASHTASEYQVLSWKLRLAAAFANASRWRVTLYDGTSIATNSVTISTTNHGYDRTVFGSYQFLAIDMNEFGFLRPTFNKVRFTLLGNQATSQQWDDIKFQSDALPVATGNYVETVNGLAGPHVIIEKVDSVSETADTMWVRYIDKFSGKVLDSTLTHVTYTRYDTCFIVDTVDARNFYVHGNPYCRGIQSVVAGTNVTVDNTDPLNPIVSASGGGGGSTNLNVGTGFGVAVDGTNNLKRLADGFGILTDSTSTANSLRRQVDTSVVATPHDIAVTRDILQTNINLKQDLITTTSETIVAASTAVTFTVTVPSSYNDYIIFRNGVANEPITDYTTSGNIVTGTGFVAGDRIQMQRKK